jgi:hypothetical protein
LDKKLHKFTRQAAPVTLTTLVPMFSQPGGASTFFDTVVSKKVSHNRHRLIFSLV